MEWFFGYSGNAAKWFRDMIKVAVLSARANTSLEPHCLFDGEDDGLTEWLRRNGVTVHRTAVPFKDELSSQAVVAANEGTPYNPANASGHFLRLLVPDFSSGGISLYTDCDVMFTGEPDFGTIDIFGACAELGKDGRPSPRSFNSGVMAINNERFARERPRLIRFFRSKNFYSRKAQSYDQVLLNIHFKRKWNMMPPYLNWRPWQGVDERAKIVHFHGPKPQRIEAILRGDHLRDEAGLIGYINRDRGAYQAYHDMFRSFLAEAG
ncbi:glycosyltransferase [Paracoccus sp. S-4012]|uniref:glycosyltransferase n=1 Tax=Paracoccus sp. S-4012 TaxID=2665648 RepID=UPI0018A1D096|nr:glycosyltransferase [Paracoccus sp. S-4012]